MTNKDFWESIDSIIASGFNPTGQKKLEEYATEIIEERLLFQRFSSFEQHGCAKGGITHVIATILAGAEDSTDYVAQGIVGFKRERKQAEKQAQRIEEWAQGTEFLSQKTPSAYPWIEESDSAI